jgi:hypothetical protein
MIALTKGASKEVLELPIAEGADVNANHPVTVLSFSCFERGDEELCPAGRCHTTTHAYTFPATG